MSNIAGEVKYTVSIDTTKLKSGLKEASKEVDKSNKDNTDKLKGMAKSAGGVALNIAKVGAGVAIAAVGAATAEVAGLATAAGKSFSEYEQLYGGIKALFNDDAALIAKVQDQANGAWETMQTSVNDYYQQFASVYALVAADITDQNLAIEQTNRLMGIEADLANTYGYDMEYAATAINWALKGSYSYIDNLNIGIKGTKEGFLEAAQGAGYMVSSVDELSSSDIISVIEHYTEKVGALNRSQQEAATTIQGSLKMTKASWDNLMTGLADDTQEVAPLIKTLVGSIGVALKNLLPIVKTSLEGAVELISEITPMILAMIPELVNDVLPAILEAAKGIVGAVVAAAPQILQTLSNMAPELVNAVVAMVDIFCQNLPLIINALFQAAMTIVKALIPKLPEILKSIVTALLGIVQMLTAPENLSLILEAGVMLLEALVDSIPVVIDALAVALPDIISSVVAFLVDPKTIGLIMRAAVTLFMALVQATPQVLGALFEAFKRLFTDLWAKLGSIFSDFAGRFADGIGGAIKRAINGMLGIVESMINKPINAINGALSAINAIPGVNVGTLPNVKIPRMATGGIVPANAGGHLILAGEGGQNEWVVPESKMADLIAKINSQTAQGSNITVNVSGIYATSESQKREVAMDIWEKINEVNRSRMGALNI